VGSRQRASIKDVAALAGTSPATVSKVLNAMPGSGISAPVAERVRQSASALRYAPSPAARSLRRQRTQTVGILTNDLLPFSADVVHGVAAAALARGYTSVLALHGEDSELEAQHLQLGLHGQVDGLVVVPARGDGNQAHYDELRARGIPFVFVSRYLPGYPADFVGLQNEQAAYHLTRVLIAQGADIIAYMAAPGPRSSTQVERFAGFQRALVEAGLPHADDILAASLGESKASYLTRLLQRRPRVNGLLWASYFHIEPALLVLAEHGIRVPTDIRFAGFDPISLVLFGSDDYRALRVLDAPWPTAIQPGFAMGQRALELLTYMLDGSSPSAPQHITLEPRYQWLPDSAHKEGVTL
jgi:LacI family transcriptional regulator